MPAFSSIEEIKKAILSAMKQTMEEVAEKAYDLFYLYLQIFYGSYAPTMYERTYSLLGSLMKTDVQSTGNGFQVEIKYDSFTYATGANPSSESVLSAANTGGHGAAGLNVVWIGGVAIWNEPVNIISAELVGWIRDGLSSAGLPIV